MAVTRCCQLAHLALSISYTTKMVVTRSSARSHDAPKGPIKALTTARKGVNSSWRADARAPRQTRPDAAAGQARPESPPREKHIAPQRYLKKKKMYASSIPTQIGRDSGNEEESEDGEELQSDDGESDAADGQERVDRTKPLQHPVLKRLLMCFYSWSRPDIRGRPQ